jgi:hypothetical protein
MNRKELYDKVKVFGLGDEIKKKFGKNFTQVSNADLEAVINAKAGAKKPVAPKTVKTAKVEKPEAGNTDNESKALVKLVSTLHFKKYLTTQEVDEILGVL